jgi:hypothetical protein
LLQPKKLSCYGCFHTVQVGDKVTSICTEIWSKGSKSILYGYRKRCIELIEHTCIYLAMIDIPEKDVKK